MRVADESGIVENINVNETSPAAVKMEDLLVEDGNVTLTIRLIMQGKVSVLIVFSFWAIKQGWTLIYFLILLRLFGK